ncbi:MAG: DUF1800 domain-containing protein [Rhodoferax sp.]|nr:DUF1800 domain-containing protein [Rhodoferax sp.]
MATERVSGRASDDVQDHGETRRLAPMAAVVGSTAGLAACGGGGSDSGSGVLGGTDGNLLGSSTTPSPLVPATDAQAARFLLHASFAVTDADIAALRSLGYSAWLDAEIAKAPGTSGWDWLNSEGYNNIQSPSNFYDTTAAGDYMVWGQLMSAPDPVRKRAALAWSELMVVSLSGISTIWRIYAMAGYWDTLVTHALGNFRDLLEAITLNSAMGHYLNTKGNLKENTATGRQPDENYAREVMQLFSIGLYLLKPDGTLDLDAQGNPQETYGASDVSQLARVFTGYDVDMSQSPYTPVPQVGGGSRNIPAPAFHRLPLKLNPANHSTLEATFLGVTIPANTPADEALKTALDTLFLHPNTAPFICKQLIQRLVTSNPSPAYVGRVVAVFANNGKGVRGDLAQVFKAVVMDSEALSADGLTDPEFGKLREPMLRLLQWGRTFGVGSANGTWKISDLSTAGDELGQSPLRAPSVFNFFRPGYVPASTVSAPATGLSEGKVAPEFQIVNETSVSGYLNYIMGVIDGGIGGGDIKVAYTAELALVLDPAALVQRLNLLLTAGQLSQGTMDLIAATLRTVPVTASSTATLKRNRVCAAVFMVMASVQYLVQK